MNRLRSFAAGRLAGLALATAIALSAFGSGAFADDRDILRDSTVKPYLFIILDTSGSMNWSTKCTQAEYDAGECSFLCPTGDCPLPRDGDDPSSKMRQAKEALYEVLREVEDVDFGFATYNQDGLRVPAKHWLYKVSTTQAVAMFNLSGGVTFPIIGSEEVFGENWWDDRGGTCVYAPNTYNDSTGVGNIGCFPRRQDATNPDANDCEDGNGNNTNVCAPADTNDAWEYTRFRRLPRLDYSGNITTYFYLRVPNGARYRVKYSGAVTYGAANFNVNVEVALCTNEKCTTVSGVTTKAIRYDLVNEFVYWSNNVDRTPPQNGYTGNTYSDGDRGDDPGTTNDILENDTCDGWEPNSDTPANGNVSGDIWATGGTNINLKQVNDSTLLYDPTGTTHDWRFQVGDVIPLIWNQSNKERILDRLAPRLDRLAATPTTDPEAFAAATYLNNTRSGTQNVLNVKNSAEKPIIPSGSTPLANSLRSFRQWYKGCTDSTSSCAATGWDDFAAANDPQWNCRSKFILFLTDGDETCGGNAPNYAGVLHDRDGVSTYVVAFGIDDATLNPGNQLQDMADRGGTGDPIFPKDKDELIAALRAIVSNIREQASAFASAAVPQVQANATDKIFLSSFTPLQDASYWAGRMDAFLKPLPLDDQGRPDRETLCSDTVKSSCFLWDAGDVQNGHQGEDGYAPEGLLLQAPHPDDLQPVAPWDAADLQLGNGADERRVFYTQLNEPGNRRLFTYPTTNSQKYDLWPDLGISFVVGNSVSEAAANAQANAIIVKTLLEKEDVAEFPDPEDPGEIIEQPMTYLLGDLFHGDPAILTRPSNSSYYSSDPYVGKRLCGNDWDSDRNPGISYRWFADRNFCRRSILFTAANDGQLHAFDSGTFEEAGSGVECLLPAKDADGDGIAEVDEFGDGIIDYDIGDDLQGNKSCSTAADCATGPCSGGFCRDVLVGVVDGAYNNGTGRELFSFIPRAMLPKVARMANGADRNTDFWGMDGGPRIDDVLMDPLASDTGNTVCENREWRTVLIGGYREGGPGYYALDITQPDTFNATNVPQASSGYVPSCMDGGSACGNRPYPAVLWEFNDRELVTTGSGSVLASLDEDTNGVADLGNSWSKATTGRIRVCTGSCTEDETEDRFVAIFGGGIGDDPAIVTGNYVYMVDVETGKTIYKEWVVGSVPSDIAAVDVNGDTYIDRIYFGTTAGFLYKIQLETSAAQPLLLDTQTVSTRVGASNFNHTVTRLQGADGNPDKYDPFQVFSTGGRPIYHEVAAIYVSTKNRVAMAFGTGNRWDLWDGSPQEGRFYMILDDEFADTDGDGVLDVTCSGCTEPLTESRYASVAPTAANGLLPLLTEGNGTTLPGWYITLGEGERIITEAFSLAGITSFTSFDPTDSTNEDGTCSRAGSSRIFIVGTVTAAGYAENRGRFDEVSQFTTPIYVEQSATKNPEGGGSADPDHADQMTEALEQIRDELKSLQSTRCKYANYTQNLKTIRSDTGVVFVAPIPICIDPTSWKEF